MSKVYVVSSYGNNIDSAAKFGEIIELTTGPINPFALDRLAWNMAPQLLQFESEDYFLLTGPGSGYIIAGILLFGKHDSINCLRYDSMFQDYVPVVIRLSDIPEFDEAESPSGKIFVLNFSGHSIISALDYSNLPEEQKLVTVTTGNLDQSNTQEMINKVAVKFNTYKPGDMLIISGPAILHIIAAAVLYKMRRDISLLLFNPKRQSYSKRDIELRHMKMIAQLAVQNAAA